VSVDISGTRTNCANSGSRASNWNNNPWNSNWNIGLRAVCDDNFTRAGRLRPPAPTNDSFVVSHATCYGKHITRSGERRVAKHRKPDLHPYG
jgi:hypothetical protein